LETIPENGAGNSPRPFHSNAKDYRVAAPHNGMADRR
jgi:hypothetical protein